MTNVVSMIRVSLEGTSLGWPGEMSGGVSVEDLGWGDRLEHSRRKGVRLRQAWCLPKMGRAEGLRWETKAPGEGSTKHLIEVEAQQRDGF